MSEEEKIELIYTVYGYNDILEKAKTYAKRTADDIESKILADLLGSSIGVKLLSEIRRIVREEVCRVSQDPPGGRP